MKMQILHSSKLLKVARGLAFARWFSLLTLVATVTVAWAVPAAFVQSDAVTKEMPYSAFIVKRDGRGVPSNSELQPCDVLEFVPTQSKFDKVVLTSTRGGKSLVLRPGSTPLSLSCERVSLAGNLWDVWKIISAGDRVAAVSAATRGTDFTLPIFSSESSNIVAGKRALYVGWTGGRPPFRVLITRGRSSDVLVDVKGIADNHVRLPELDLKPGQYSLAVANTPGIGEPEAMQEDNLFVVPASELPPIPTALFNAKLGRADTELLYGFYLEGLPGARWAFEAMQHVASIADVSPAAKDWLRGYAEARKR